MLYVNCTCTNQIQVKASQCGESVACSCGQLVSVPRLSQLRQQNGVGYQNLTPVERLLKLDDEDALLTSDDCASCGCRSGNLLGCRIQCESIVVKSSSLLGTIGYICVLPFFGILSGLSLLVAKASEQDNPEIHGRNTEVIVPVPICPECEKAFRRSHRQRISALRKVDVYRDLLQHYPDATTEYYADPNSAAA